MVVPEFHVRVSQLETPGAGRAEPRPLPGRLWHIGVGVVTDTPLVHTILSKYTPQGALTSIESKGIT